MKSPRSREHDSEAEHPLNDVGQRVLLVVFLAVWIADSFLWRISVPAVHRLPAYVRLPLGAAVSGAAALLILKAHRAIFGASAGQRGLVRDGVFALVRHPMYLGSWLFYLGLALLTLSAAAAALSIVILVFYCLMARYEERVLLGRHGQSFREYRSQVPMLLPFKIRQLPWRRGARERP